MELSERLRERAKHYPVWSKATALKIPVRHSRKPALHTALEFAESDNVLYSIQIAFYLSGFTCFYLFPEAGLRSRDCHGTKSEWHHLTGTRHFNLQFDRRTSRALAFLIGAWHAEPVPFDSSSAYESLYSSNRTILVLYCTGETLI